MCVVSMTKILINLIHVRSFQLFNAGVSREFRVVRDNRVNRNVNREAKPASAASATLTTENVSGKGYGISPLSVKSVYIFISNVAVSI